MEVVFLKLLNMSITASWLILAVLVLRLFLNKAPKFIRCILWGLVGLRLILPFSVESVLSLIPSSEPLPKNIIYTAVPTVNTGIPIIDHAVDPIISQSFSPAPLTSINPTQVISLIASIVWICGVVVMLVYMLISYLRIRIKVREAVVLYDNVYLCDHISSPFILGIIKPKIYLPSNMTASDFEYVISHEKSHLKRRDHWWKPLGFFLLSVYWFNPAIWVAYILLCRDIELACDEKVIKQMDTNEKKAYTNALLCCSIPRKMISACPLAFGEIGVKNRVKNVLNYKKPAFWIILIAVVVSIVTAVCFLTDPASIKLNQLSDTGDCSRLFENIYHLDIISGDKALFTKDKSIIEKIVVELEDIEIKKSPVSHDRSEDRDKTNRIIINNSTLCFNQDFSEFWMNDDVKPTLSYSVSSPSKVKSVFDYATTLLSENNYTSGAIFDTPICWVNNKDDYARLFNSQINASSTKPIDYGNTLNGDMEPELATYYRDTISLFKFESTDDIKDFISQFGDLYAFDLRYEKYPSFTEMMSVYDDGYFKDKVLFIACVESFDPNEYPVVSDVYNDGKRLVINFSADNDYYKRSLSMTDWFIGVEFERNDIAGCSEYECFLNYNVTFNESTNLSELDHLHKAATEPNVIDDPQFMHSFCGTVGNVTVKIDGTNHSVSELVIYELDNILSNLKYSEDKICDCPASVEYGGYSFNTELAFARSTSGQTELTSEQVFALNTIIANSLSHKEYVEQYNPEYMNSYTDMIVYETKAADNLHTLNLVLSQTNANYYISTYVKDTWTSEFISAGEYDYINGNLTLYDIRRGFIYVFEADKEKESLTFNSKLSAHHDYDQVLSSLLSEKQQLKLTSKDPYYVNGQKSKILDIDYDGIDEYIALSPIYEKGKVTKCKLSIWKYDESLPLSEIAVEGKELATLTFPTNVYYMYFDYSIPGELDFDSPFIRLIKPGNNIVEHHYKIVYRYDELYLWEDGKRVEF